MSLSERAERRKEEIESKKSCNVLPNPLVSKHNFEELFPVLTGRAKPNDQRLLTAEQMKPDWIATRVHLIRSCLVELVGYNLILKLN